MYSCVLFDLDGTLTDSREGIVNSVRYALEKMNRPALTERELNQFVGPPLQQMFQQMCGFTPEEAIEGIARYRERYNTIGKFENAAAPGAAELLRELKERGYLVAPQKDAEKADVIRNALQRLGVTEGDCRQVLMVGDRKYDVLGAAACGMDCVGVEFFPGAEPGELADAGAVAVVKTVAELRDFILNH